MTNMVKRFVALTAAGLLFVSAAFTSLAEEITEGDILPAETEEMTTPEVMASEITETSETIPEPESVPEAETAAQPDHEGTKEAEIKDDDYFTFEEQDAGSVDPDLTEIMFPNGGAPVIIDDDDAGTVESGLTDALIPNGGTPVGESVESAEPAANDVDMSSTQLRITLDAGQAIRVEEQTVLTAQPESEITGVVTWEILNESLEEESW